VSSSEQPISEAVFSTPLLISPFGRKAEANQNLPSYLTMIGQSLKSYALKSHWPHSADSTAK